MLRKFPREIKRIVVKLGSSLIATYAMKPQRARLRSLVEQMSELKKQDKDIVLVSSGAIVLGMGQLKERLRPHDVVALQARAAIGQAVLMRTYSDLFKKNGVRCAQVLLTWDDFDNRIRYNNARSTLLALLKLGVVPVVNENDTISTQEIKFGDNDRLSALVAGLIHADLLVILSDVEGLYDLKDSEKKIFDEISEVTDEIRGLARGTNKRHIAKGGMTTKLEAVRIATQANVPCVIAHGETPDVLKRILKGERIGTFFVEKEERLLSKKHWISLGAKPKGQLIVDEGAQAALLKGGRSLLLPGIVGWEGHFKVHDVVVVADKNRQEIARGITNYSVADLEKIEDKKGKPEAIHCDNLVLCKR